MYHVELRQFPHNMSRFNLDERALRAIVEPWTRGAPVEFGERRWDPARARLTVLEGPELALEQLTMGRGWPIAQREGTDVTERVLAAAHAALAASAGNAVAGAALAGTAPGSPGAGAPPTGPSSPVSALGDPFSLGMQLAALLGPDALRLLDAWRTAARANPGMAPSDTLARAEAALREERPRR